MQATGEYLVDLTSPPSVRPSDHLVPSFWSGWPPSPTSTFHAAAAGQSIGNRILGIGVLDAGTGRSLPYPRAFTRALVSNLSVLALLLGYLWMRWEPGKRTWHDIVADSLVVNADLYPPGEFGRRPGP